jgi:cytochrome c-type biogenesis protein CcmE
VGHWQIVYLCVLLLSGMLTIYLAALVADIVFNQIPEQTLSAQRAEVARTDVA